MTTLVAFTPSLLSSPPFSAQVALDGQNYTLATAWNIYRGGWYYSLTDQFGNLIITAALVASPPNYSILLAPGIFVTSTILFRDATQNFEISP